MAKRNDYESTNGTVLFSAPVVYVQPDYEELKRRFPYFLDESFQGKPLVPIKRCRGVSNESREVAFGYVHKRYDVSTNAVLVEMDRKGLRPALYEELLGFAERYPDEPLKFPIIALGSGKHVLGCRHVARLWFNGGGLLLDLMCRFNENWRDVCTTDDGYCHFLSVSK